MKLVFSWNFCCHVTLYNQQATGIILCQAPGSEPLEGSSTNIWLENRKAGAWRTILKASKLSSSKLSFQHHAVSYHLKFSQWNLLGVCSPECQETKMKTAGKSWTFKVAPEKALWSQRLLVGMFVCYQCTETLAAKKSILCLLRPMEAATSAANGMGSW